MISKEEVALLQSMPALILEAINAMDGKIRTHEGSLNKVPTTDSKRNITDNLPNLKQIQKSEPHQQEVGEESHSDNPANSNINLNKKMVKMETKDDMGNPFMKNTQNELNSGSTNEQMTPSEPSKLNRSKYQDSASMNYTDNEGCQHKKDKPNQNDSAYQERFDGKKTSGDKTSKPVKNMNEYEQKQAVDMIQMEPKLDQGDDDNNETPQENTVPSIYIPVDMDTHESYDICEGIAQSQRGSTQYLMSNDEERYLTTTGSFEGGNVFKGGLKSSSRTDGAESFTEDGDDDVFGDTGVQNEAELERLAIMHALVSQMRRSPVKGNVSKDDDDDEEEYGMSMAKYLEKNASKVKEVDHFEVEAWMTKFQDTVAEKQEKPRILVPDDEMILPCLPENDNEIQQSVHTGNDSDGEDEASLDKLIAKLEKKFHINANHTSTQSNKPTCEISDLLDDMIPEAWLSDAAERLIEDQDHPMTRIPDKEVIELCQSSDSKDGNENLLRKLPPEELESRLQARVENVSHSANPNSNIWNSYSSNSEADGPGGNPMLGTGDVIHPIDTDAKLSRKKELTNPTKQIKTQLAQLQNHLSKYTPRKSVTKSLDEHIMTTSEGKTSESENWFESDLSCDNQAKHMGLREYISHRSPKNRHKPKLHKSRSGKSNTSPSKSKYSKSDSSETETGRQIDRHNKKHQDDKSKYGRERSNSSESEFINQLSGPRKKHRATSKTMFKMSDSSENELTNSADTLKKKHRNLPKPKCRTSGSSDNEPEKLSNKRDAQKDNMLNLGSPRKKQRDAKTNKLKISDSSENDLTRSLDTPKEKHRNLPKPKSGTFKSSDNELGNLNNNRDLEEDNMLNPSSLKKKEIDAKTSKFKMSDSSENELKKSLDTPKKKHRNLPKPKSRISGSSDNEVGNWMSNTREAHMDDKPKFKFKTSGSSDNEPLKHGRNGDFIKDSTQKQTSPGRKLPSLAGTKIPVSQSMFEESQAAPKHPSYESLEYTNQPGNKKMDKERSKRNETEPAQDRHSRPKRTSLEKNQLHQMQPLQESVSQTSEAPLYAISRMPDDSNKVKANELFQIQPLQESASWTSEAPLYAINRMPDDSNRLEEKELFQIQPLQESVPQTLEAPLHAISRMPDESDMVTKYIPKRFPGKDDSENEPNQKPGLEQSSQHLPDSGQREEYLTRSEQSGQYPAGQELSDQYPPRHGQSGQCLPRSKQYDQHPPLSYQNSQYSPELGQSSQFPSQPRQSDNFIPRSGQSSQYPPELGPTGQYHLGPGQRRQYPSQLGQSNQFNTTPNERSQQSPELGSTGVPARRLGSRSSTDTDQGQFAAGITQFVNMPDQDDEDFDDICDLPGKELQSMADDEASDSEPFSTDINNFEQSTPSEPSKEKSAVRNDEDKPQIDDKESQTDDVYIMEDILKNKTFSTSECQTDEITILKYGQPLPSVASSECQTDEVPSDNHQKVQKTETVSVSCQTDYALHENDTSESSKLSLLTSSIDKPSYGKEDFDLPSTETAGCQTDPDKDLPLMTTVESQTDTDLPPFTATVECQTDPEYEALDETLKDRIEDLQNLSDKQKMKMKAFKEAAKTYKVSLIF